MTVRKRSSSGFDIDRALNLATRRVDVGELYRRGHKKVTVINRTQIEALVRKAVLEVLSTSGDRRGADEIRQIEQQAQRRFGELMRRHQQVLKLKAEAEDALRELSGRLAKGQQAGNVDLEPLARQVAAMGSLLRGEAPAVDQKQSQVLDLLQRIAGKMESGPKGAKKKTGDPASAGAADDRFERILYQMERLAASVEATERAMKRGGGRVALGDAADGDASRRRSPMGKPSGAYPDLFRAIVEENLRLTQDEPVDSEKSS